MWARAGVGPGIAKIEPAKPGEGGDRHKSSNQKLVVFYLGIRL
jgi:hypothetical protein